MSRRFASTSLKTHHITPVSFVSRIVAAVERLLEFPESGRIVPERNERTLREVLVGRFRVVYRTRADTIEIVTVFRGSRLFPGDV